MTIQNVSVREGDEKHDFGERVEQWDIGPEDIIDRDHNGRAYKTNWREKYGLSRARWTQIVDAACGLYRGFRELGHGTLGEQLNSAACDSAGAAKRSLTALRNEVREARGKTKHFAPAARN